MIINIISKKPGAKFLAEKFKSWINSNTRFNVHQAEVRSQTKARFKGGSIGLYGIRLKTAKIYHGNSPGAIDVRPMRRKGWNRELPSKPIKVSFLEGADWVDFNDTLNDFLDFYGVSADVKSWAVIIRKGTKRRIKYESQTVTGKHRCGIIWQLNGAPEDFEDFIDRPVVPLSSMPVGGPCGFYRMMVVMPQFIIDK